MFARLRLAHDWRHLRGGSGTPALSGSCSNFIRHGQEAHYFSTISMRSDLGSENKSTMIYLVLEFVFMIVCHPNMGPEEPPISRQRVTQAKLARHCRERHKFIRRAAPNRMRRSDDANAAGGGRGVIGKLHASRYETRNCCSNTLSAKRTLLILLTYLVIP